MPVRKAARVLCVRSMLSNPDLRFWEWNVSGGVGASIGGLLALEAHSDDTIWIELTPDGSGA
jgi:hypothetical protein